MDSSKDGSPLLSGPDRPRRASKSSGARNQSPPSPWSPTATAKHLGEVPNAIRSTSRGMPEQESYVTNHGSSPTLHQKWRKLSDAHSHISETAGSYRRRRLSLPSRVMSKGQGTRESAFTSYGLGTPPQGQHRPRAQSVAEDDRKNVTLPRAAARRRSTHDLYPGMNDDASSERIMSNGALTTVTDKYESHARAPRKVGRNVTDVERRQRMRVFVLSKNRRSLSAPSPPIDSFTDIPPVELILFEPPRPPTSEEQRPDQSMTPLTPSPPRSTNQAWPLTSVRKDDTHTPTQSSSTRALQPSISPTGLDEPHASPEAPAAADSITYGQIWVLCGVVASTLVLPLAIVILSYLSTPARYMSSIPTGPSGAATNSATTTSSSTTMTAVPTYTFPVPQSQPTIDPWHGVPLNCRQVSPINPMSNSVKPQNSPSLSPSRRSNIFCLYNNSGYYKGGIFDFLPQNIPFSHCQNIVYWSFGIRDGVPISRDEAFERKYGLEKLSDIANKSGFPDVKLLLTVGGYSEDYAQLSLLGGDSAALSRFVQRTMALMTSYRLHGVVIHWLEGEPMCQRSAADDAQALTKVFLSLRRIFRLNTFSGQLAAIVPRGSPSRNSIVYAVVNIVDFVFMDTTDMRHKPVLRSVFNAVSSNFTARCALLVDLDFDNYARQSESSFADYWFIQYVYKALNGTALTFPTDTLDPC
ncbi:hypothetical protein HPB52_004439 [Rhipicephalus sanguineus]|uniref:GH18 domain-containing protein n=1 Tax=Rhipicephalus sanguineus TaxID=34632 RepID=A0A9D4STN3_RHISA|nr:hypothetical protein HPB52_004439 [Rhipicephalus sanguineus]